MNINSIFGRAGGVGPSSDPELISAETDVLARAVYGSTPLAQGSALRDLDALNGNGAATDAMLAAARAGGDSDIAHDAPPIEVVMNDMPHHVTDADHAGPDRVSGVGEQRHVGYGDVDAGRRPAGPVRTIAQLRGKWAVDGQIAAFNAAIDRQSGPSLRVGPFLVQGGSLAERQAVARDLQQIAGTSRGRVFFAEAGRTARQERVIVDPQLDYGSAAHAHLSYGVVTMNFRAANTLSFETSRGWQNGQRVIVLAHELGHIYSRIGDDGPRHMANVTLNENPIRRELGYAPRLQYAERQIRYDQPGGPGLYATDNGVPVRRLGGVPPLRAGR